MSTAACLPSSSQGGTRLPVSEAAAALIAIDWGSSSFRAYLMTRDGAVLDVVATADGVATVQPNAFPATLDRLAALMRQSEFHEHVGADNICANIDAALRCYGQALSYCEARELEFDPNDNWLIMALKNDRRKEP